MKESRGGRGGPKKSYWMKVIYRGHRELKFHVFASLAGGNVLAFRMQELHPDE